MKLKQIQWTTKNGAVTARVMGIHLGVHKHNGGWKAQLYNGRNRPEIQTGFQNSAEAIQYAEKTLLVHELRKYFSGVEV